MTAPTDVLTITEPGIYPGIPDAVYHADPVPGGSLSSTGARRILDSPARFRWEQDHRVGKRAYDVGHVVHSKVLGVGAPVIGYPDEHLTPSGNPSTKAATVAWENEKRSAGLAIISPSDLALVDAMAEAVLAHRGARRILEQAGNAEVSAFATDPDTGANVRARLDYLTDSVAVDLKSTTGSASSRGFGREAARHGYPIQEAHYSDALEWLTGERLPFQFIVVEKAAPHFVAVHQFDAITGIVGRDLAAQARRLYADCKATDEWPAYGDEPLITQVPGWWLDQADDTDEMVI